jgi:hypothetical protein
MNTILCFLANILALVALPTLAISATDLFAVLASVAILGFCLFDYGRNSPRRRRSLSLAVG